MKSKEKGAGISGRVCTLKKTQVLYLSLKAAYRKLIGKDLDIRELQPATY